MRPGSAAELAKKAVAEIIAVEKMAAEKAIEAKAVAEKVAAERWATEKQAQKDRVQRCAQLFTIIITRMRSTGPKPCVGKSTPDVFRLKESERTLDRAHKEAAKLLSSYIFREVWITVLPFITRVCKRVS